MGTYFFTADLHFGHESILTYTPRAKHVRWVPADDSDTVSIDHHDEWVIETINAKVGPTDHLFVLGDISMHNKWKSAELISRIRGHLHLVTGNHDESKIDFYKSTDLFESISNLEEIKYCGQRIVLCHYPIAEWNCGQYKAWMLHGHCHGDFDYKAANLHDKRILDVGFDNSVNIFTNYGPFSFDDVAAFMEPQKSIEHHGKAD